MDSLTAVRVHAASGVEHSVADVEFDIGRRWCVKLQFEQSAPV